MSAELHDLSIAIGELRSFAQQQLANNAHVTSEIAKIIERLSVVNGNNAAFLEYRKTLHGRFGNLHTQMGDIDEFAESIMARAKDIELRIKELELAGATWRGQWKMLLAVLYIVSTVSSTLLVNYGANILRAIVP